MSESGELKTGAERETKDYPRQAEGGETAVEKQLGMNSQQPDTSQYDQNTAP